MSMSIRTFVSCDKCNAKVASSANSTKRADIRNARILARNEGWKLGKQKDFCKECAAEIAAAVKAAQAGLS